MAELGQDQGIEDSEEQEDARSVDPWSHASEVKPDVEHRVEFIIDVMTAMLWQRGKSAKKLSRLWGIPLSTVQNYSAEASRRCIGDADEARRDITIGARKLLKESVDGHDPLGFKHVADIWATVSGAKAPEKVQVGAIQLDDIASLQKATELNEECQTQKSEPEQNS